LEYLTPTEVAHQRDTVLALILEPPTGLPELVDEFIGKIEAYA
jgi:hypothetical protein